MNALHHRIQRAPPAQRNAQLRHTGHAMEISDSGGMSDSGWHLNNHFSNVAWVQALAGEAAVTEYDEAFRKQASHSEKIR
ncbi:UNVERIFIED_CONTAM: hypothetical protein K2H54_061625 [Gekko kuhli]